jgi:thiol-disulfide isomerase/thioredoxin
MRQSSIFFGGHSSNFKRGIVYPSHRFAIGFCYLCPLFFTKKEKKQPDMRKNMVLVLGLVAVLASAWWWYQSRLPKVVAGQVATDFEMVLPDGSPLRLSDLRGKVVLLHFWGTWCGPCRAENPHLVDLYKKYHERGFEIVSVALERNSVAAWQGIIQRDGLEWAAHVRESGRFDGPIAQLYNIHEIPATFLINREGVVIGTNLSPNLLDKMLGEQLK